MIFNRKLKLQRILSVVWIFACSLTSVLFAEPAHTPQTPPMVEEWSFWEYFIYTFVFGLIILLIVAFAKKHDEIDL